MDDSAFVDSFERKTNLEETGRRFPFKEGRSTSRAMVSAKNLLPNLMDLYEGYRNGYGDVTKGERRKDQ